jgi:hypothetical protein
MNVRTTARLDIIGLSLNVPRRDPFGKLFRRSHSCLRPDRFDAEGLYYGTRIQNREWVAYKEQINFIAVPAFRDRRKLRSAQGLKVVAFPAVRQYR